LAALKETSLQIKRGSFRCSDGSLTGIVNTLHAFLGHYFLL
jgi:hypothetical protein